MTLFEAIRELKEGQQIMGVQITTSWASPDGGGESRSAEMPYAIWERGKDEPTILVSYANLETQVRIVDLPKPKMTLARMMDQACGYIAQGLAIREQSEIAIIFRELRRYLQAHHDEIDWQAEADRKKGKE